MKLRRVPIVLTCTAAALVAVALTTVPGGPAATPAEAAADSVRLRQIDGGPGYFGRFARTFSTDPRTFPIGVWFESVTAQSDVDLDKRAGITTYVALTANSSLPLIARNGMTVVPQYEEWASRGAAAGSQAITGWLLGDEVDMRLPAAQGLAELRAAAARTPADGRPRFANFGKGVTFWNTDTDARNYVNAVHVASADNYWFTDENICGPSEGGDLLNGGVVLPAARCKLAANYGRTVDRVRGLVNPVGSRPTWAFVEVGHPFSESWWPTARPAGVTAAVWSSIIHGARGIVYFNHSFGGPAQTQHVLREPEYAAVRAEVTRTNIRIRQLAPVLNAPSVDGLVHTVGAVDVLAKYWNGAFYLIAGSRQQAAQTATLRLPCVGNATVTVLAENRKHALTAGAFTDTFASGDAVHVYRVDGGSRCGL